MPATILTSFSGQYEFEPNITSDTSRDGITAFQFSVIGKFTELDKVFQPDEVINGVPDQPPGSYRVVRRNLEHIAGDPQNGIYRLSVSGEGGTGNSALFISESSYAMQNQQVQGVISTGLAQVVVQYNLIWLYPSVTITTNSQSASASNAESKAREILAGLPISIIKDQPTPGTGTIAGPKLAGTAELNEIYITGTSIEKAGGLFRVRATASKGILVS